MRRFASILLIASLSTSAATAAAQAHTGGWLFTSSDPVNPPVVGVVSPAGAVSTLVMSLPATDVAESAIMDGNNRDVVVALTGRRISVARLMRVSAAGPILNTINLGTGGVATDVVLGPEGDYVAIKLSVGSGPTELLRVTRSGVVSTILTGGVQPRALTIDIDTGDYIVADKTTGVSVTLLRVSPDGLRVRAFATLPVPVLSQIAQDVRSGDFFVACFATQANPILIGRVTGAGAVTTFRGGTFPTFVAALHPDRASAANPSLVFSEQTAGTLSLLRAPLGPGAVSTIAPAIVGEFTHVAPHRGRNLVTVRRASGDWDVALDFPGEGGLGYALALSLTGVRPAIVLGDGRAIPLTVDAITVAGLNGSLAAVLSGDRGVLDASGRAAASLRTGSLGLRGARVWLTAITIDPAAPLGIRTIADPRVIIL